jgi:hypothetical protein
MHTAMVNVICSIQAHAAWAYWHTASSSRQPNSQLAAQALHYPMQPCHVTVPSLRCFAWSTTSEWAIVVNCGVTGLQVLALEDNGLSNWREVCRLAALPCLTRLHLSGNPLPEVVYPSLALTPPGDVANASTTSTSSSSEHGPSTGPSSSSEQAVQAPGAAFPCLQALLLGSTQVTSWSSVDALDAFPALQELRLSGTPLMAAAGPHAGRRYEVCVCVCVCVGGWVGVGGGVGQGCLHASTLLLLA